MPAPEALVALSRRLGDPAEGLAILAEGNTSTTDGADRGCFWVKASGGYLATINDDGFVHVKLEPMLAAFDGVANDPDVSAVLEHARHDPSEKRRPSVETFMHAYLLSLAGVKWIGHTHPTSLLAVLCSSDAEEQASARYFPDEVVCCGPASCFVPYRDPGLPLAQEIRARVESYSREYGSPPITIWLQSHGLVALGETPAEVLSATLMSEKAARVRLATRDPVPMGAAQIERIHQRADEHYRQKLLRDTSIGP